MILTTMTCLALNVYFEARNQDVDGQRLVAEVTMNRVASDKFPDTVCKVVWQRKAFSWTHDGKSDKPRNKEAWHRAQEIAKEVLLEGCAICTRATYYHTTESLPYWASEYTVVALWGDHIFYVDEKDKING